MGYGTYMMNAAAASGPCSTAPTAQPSTVSSRPLLFHQRAMDERFWRVRA